MNFKSVFGLNKSLSSKKTYTEKGNKIMAQNPGLSPNAVKYGGLSPELFLSSMSKTGEESDKLAYQNSKNRTSKIVTGISLSVALVLGGLSTKLFLEKSELESQVAELKDTTTKLKLDHTRMSQGEQAGENVLVSKKLIATTAQNLNRLIVENNTLKKENTTLKQKKLDQ